MRAPLHKVSTCGLLYLPDKGALVLRRSATETFLTGYYELPGGGLDEGETLEGGLIREFKEETGYSVKVLNPYHVFPYLLDNRTPVVNISYFVEPIEGIGKVILSEEHDHYKWLNLDGLGKIKMTKEMQENISSGFKLLPD